ncbi:methylenetetrahydrofolate reductase [Streptomyces malaysiensis subsp. malaysiensis]|uniref:Methylenetetrahydrofolate reductase n=1 Tax=Streptomyces malaysiensis TaxID=92644 RepID=A0ABX6VXC0_STRMQ|nr:MULTISPECIES: methylenetetrahydrofolate reductase [Streptomyces]QPI54010.1 methylenetetrahydrofolate reductase [Streptomyces solisilvae]UHH15385.1 methylenetetrahydrofolate reductase [Streptomyces sp. HNM0561]
MTLATDQEGSAPRTARAAVAHALRNATYEILPFKSAEEKVLAHVPTDVALTVTTTEAKGLGPTIDLAASLSKQGYSAAPHIAARLVRDRAHLSDLVDQLRDSGIDRLFCIGGDAAEPVGDYTDALSLLQGLRDLDHPFSSIGIGGYPEGHGSISDELIERALESKAPYADLIITQLCFDADTTIRWARKAQDRGITLPIRVGIPGAISRQKLIRVSAGLGLGQSARFLKKQQTMFWRFFLPGGYSPNKLIQKLTSAFAEQDNNLRGFHVFTFNDLDSTEAWRKAWLARLT